MIGLTKRRLYKPERKPARDKGVLKVKLPNGLYEGAPIACSDASPGEVAKALYAIAEDVGVRIGRTCGYDSLKDEYTVIGKSLATGKAQDFKVQGEPVAGLIWFIRSINGGQPLDDMQLTRVMNALEAERKVLSQDGPKIIA